MAKDPRDELGVADTVDAFCRYCLADRLDKGLLPVKNDQNGLCLNLCLLPSDADFEHDSADKTPRELPYEQAARISRERRLASAPLRCPDCGGPLNFQDGHAYCVLRRLGRCPPNKKENG